MLIQLPSNPSSVEITPLAEPPGIEIRIVLHTTSEPLSIRASPATEPKPVRSRGLTPAIKTLGVASLVLTAGLAGHFLGAPRAATTEQAVGVRMDGQLPTEPPFQHRVVQIGPATPDPFGLH